MAARRLILLAMFIAAPALAQSGLTGTWTGTYSMSIQISGCQNKTFSWTGNATFVLLQAGSGVTGRIDLTNFTFINNNCTTNSAELTRLVFGTVNNSLLTLGVPNDPSVWLISGTPSGNNMTLSLGDPNGLTGTFTLSRLTGNPTTSFTGTWSGNYALSDVCPNGTTKKNYSGTFTLALTQTGSNAAGAVTMTNVPLYDSNCGTIANLTQTLSVAGSVDGATFTGAAFDPSGLFDFPLTITGNTVTVSGSSSTSTSGTFTIAQSSTQPPASDFSGHYDGTYAESDNGFAICVNVGAVNFQGAASVNLIQAGNMVSGVLVLEDTLAIVSNGNGACAVIEGGQQVLPVYGTISNGTVSLTVPLNTGALHAFVFNFSGNTISGTMQDSFGDLMQFSTTRTAQPTPPSGRRRTAR